MITWVIVIVAGSICIGYLLLRKKISIDSARSLLFPQDRKTTINKYKIATAQEIAKSQELRAILEAKQELVRARAINRKLESEISVAGSRTEEIRNSLPSAKLRH